MKKIQWLILCMCSSAIGLRANVDTVNYPVIGKPAPDIVLNDVRYYTKNIIQGRDFHGKWLVLDFWSKGCGACIASFPKMNALQAAMKDSMQLILVGINGGFWGQGVESLFEKLRKLHDLDMAVAYDSVLHTQWGISTLPHIIIIDPEGIVRAITGRVDQQNLLALMQGKQHELRYKKNNFELENFEDPVRLNEPFLNAGNVSHDLDFEYRSILSRFDPTIEGMTRSHVVDIDSWINIQRWIGEDKAYWQGTGLEIAQLYRLAYAGETDFFLINYNNTTSPHYGSFYPIPILEMRDSASLSNDLSNFDKLYNYSLIIPKQKASKAELMWQMQCDLMKFFPYKATVETRQLPCYELIATETARKKLRTKGLDSKLTTSDGYTYIKYVNAPVRNLLTIINSVTGRKIPVIDKTGIEGNIDLNIDAELKNFEAVRKSLQKSGLDIIKGTKEMKCIVLRDK